MVGIAVGDGVVLSKLFREHEHELVCEHKFFCAFECEHEFFRFVDGVDFRVENDGVSCNRRVFHDAESHWVSDGVHVADWLTVCEHVMYADSIEGLVRNSKHNKVAVGVWLRFNIVDNV